MTRRFVVDSPCRCGASLLLAVTLTAATGCQPACGEGASGAEGECVGHLTSANADSGGGGDTGRDSGEDTATHTGEDSATDTGAIIDPGAVLMSMTGSIDGTAFSGECHDGEMPYRLYVDDSLYEAVQLECNGLSLYLYQAYWDGHEHSAHVFGTGTYASPIEDSTDRTPRFCGIAYASLNTIRDGSCSAEVTSWDAGTLLIEGYFEGAYDDRLHSLAASGSFSLTLAAQR